MLQKDNLSLFPQPSLEPGEHLVLWRLTKSFHERECGGGAVEIGLNKSVLKGLVESCRNFCRVGESGEGAQRAHLHPTHLVYTTHLNLALPWGKVCKNQNNK